jgi:Zn-dependent peptidase ImmA (M78 family)
MDGGPKALRAIAQAEAVAVDLRLAWELGENPIPNMTELLEEKGLKVLVEDLPQKVSGFTCLVRRAGFAAPVPAVVVNRNMNLERRRLTLAHELAHRVIDPKYLADKDVERSATRFAGAFLVPRAHLEREIGKHRNALGYRELLHLKRLYRVSAAALLLRLRDIEIIDDGVLSTAFQTVARSWRSEEPEPIEHGAAARGTMELPRRFERLCYWALAEKLISVPKAAELLRKPVDIVEAELKGPWRAHAGRR